MSNLEDIFLWPDYSWCYRSEAAEMAWKSDDYLVLTFDGDYYVNGDGRYATVEDAINGTIN